MAIDTIYLAMADYLAAKGPELAPDEWANHARMLSHILYEGTRQPEPGEPARLVTGHELMQRLSIGPGPRIGALLAIIEEARVAGDIATPEEALTLARESLNNMLEQE